MTDRAWRCSNCGQINSEWAGVCGRCCPEAQPAAQDQLTEPKRAEYLAEADKILNEISPAPTREPEPADDLVEWLNEMRIYEENSEETTEAFTRTIARIAADAETIRALREERDELGYWKLRTHDYDAIISHSQDLKERAERAEAKLAQARVSIERMRVAALMADWDDFNVAIDAALAEFEK